MAVTTADSGTVTADSLFITASGAPATTLTTQDIANIAAAILAAAAATPIHADTRKMNGAAVQGDGSEADKWRGASV